MTQNACVDVCRPERAGVYGQEDDMSADTLSYRHDALVHSSTLRSSNTSSYL